MLCLSCVGACVWMWRGGRNVSVCLPSEDFFVYLSVHLLWVGRLWAGNQEECIQVMSVYLGARSCHGGHQVSILVSWAVCLDHSLPPQATRSLA